MSPVLHPRALIVGLLGIDCRVGTISDTMEIFGDPTNGEAVAVRVGNRVEVILLDSRSWPTAIHEALHLVLGTDTLGDETGMIAVEWVITRLLHRYHRAGWRWHFSEFGLPGHGYGLVGEDDSFLQSWAWKDCVKTAVQEGWLVDGTKCPLRGPHPNLHDNRWAWRSYSELMGNRVDFTKGLYR